MRSSLDVAALGFDGNLKVRQRLLNGCQADELALFMPEIHSTSTAETA